MHDDDLGSSGGGGGGGAAMSPAASTLIDDTGTAHRDEHLTNVMKSLSEGELGTDEVKQPPANNNTATTEVSFSFPTYLILLFTPTCDSMLFFLLFRAIVNKKVGFSMNLQAKRSSLKRTLTLPRILQMSRTRRVKQQGNNTGEQCNLDQVRNNMGSKKVTRKASLKESIKVVKQYVSNLVTHNHKTASRDGLGSSAGDIRQALSRPAHIPADSVPGVVGLRNHGNTCFMNAVLQCLSHTDILAEYFVLDQYKADLSKKKNSKKYGTKGEITEQLALLLKAIWYCKYDPEMSTTFKSVVDKYGSQYRGNLQHDAQEFLLWLLDKVHEDLNQATNKKYKIIKVSFLGFVFLVRNWVYYGMALKIYLLASAQK